MIRPSRSGIQIAMQPQRIWLGEEDDEAADRQTASLAGVAVTLILLIVGLFLVRELYAASAMMGGGANCDLLMIRSF